MGQRGTVCAVPAVGRAGDVAVIGNEQDSFTEDQPHLLRGRRL
jgi:hypothetical protein